MEKKNEALLALLAENQYRQLKESLLEMNEVDIAAFFEEISKDKAVTVFRTLPKEVGAEVFSDLSPDIQEHIINTITDRELGVIIEELFVDDAVDLLEELPANVVKRVLKNASADTRDLINQFLQYPENSAGSIMTAEYVDLRQNMTVADALLRIRRTGTDKETIYTCYVVDTERRLQGIVTVKTLLMSQDDDMVADIMETEVIHVTTSDHREVVAQCFAKYGFLSVPVADTEGRLVGIVTIDDVVEVIQQEATEDFEKMAAMLPSEKPYLKTSVFALAKNRIVWLLVLMVSAMITGGVLERFEHAFAVLPLLVTFIPMLTDTGGNAGAQSSTLIIRGMALSEIKMSDVLKVLRKELGVSMLVGLILAIVNYVRLVIQYPGNEMIALTVVLSLFATIIIAKTIGGLLPILAKLLHTDPAIMAAPLVTTIVDAFSLVIYFSLAQRLLAI